jgi:hypothetical protein
MSNRVYDTEPWMTQAEARANGTSRLPYRNIREASVDWGLFFVSMCICGFIAIPWFVGCAAILLAVGRAVYNATGALF